MCAEVCFDCDFVLCFVVGYWLQFGEIAHKRVHLTLALTVRGTGSFVGGNVMVTTPLTVRGTGSFVEENAMVGENALVTT